MARKPRAEEAASQVIRVRITTTERRDLEHVAKENGTSLTDVIRLAVNTFVADYRDKPVFRGPESVH